MDDLEDAIKALEFPLEDNVYYREQFARQFAERFGWVRKKPDEDSPHLEGTLTEPRV